MRKKQTCQWETLSMGTSYYPEQWDSKFWRQDLKRMKACGITTVRIAEFARQY